MNLYEIGKEYNELINYIELSGDEHVPEVVNEFLEEVSGDFEQKVENTVYILRNKEAQAKALKDEEKRLQLKRKRLEKEVQSMKDWIEFNMKETEQKHIKLDLFDVKLRKNPPKAEIKNEDLIPEEFITREEVVKINKRSLLERLKEGELIDGVELVQEERLDIK